MQVASEAEASLRMVASGAGFRGGTLYQPKYRLRAKKKDLRCKTSWFSVRKYMMAEKKGLRLPISGFSVSKEKNKKLMVSPQNGDTRGGPPFTVPPSDATVQKQKGKRP